MARWDISMPTNMGERLSERLEPQILRAAETDNIDALRQIVSTTRARGRLNDQLLGIALKRSSERGNVEATRYLLTEGASAQGNFRIPLLILAAEHNRVGIVELLLEFGADVEARDKEGRTALMVAALKNHWHILNLLIARGADVNAKDSQDQNVLHILAASKETSWGEDVVDLILHQNISLDGDKGQDKLRRTPLHWACATGKLTLVQKLLSSPGKAANIEAVGLREKTSLHLAATYGHEDIVEMLLRHGAQVKCVSEGGWTPLHNAAEKDSVGVARRLIAAGANVNARLPSGITPLHIAAQYGNLEVVKCLLECKGIEVDCRDIYGSTPLHQAAQNRHTDCYRLLAPLNQTQFMSEDEIGACKGFNATIVSFGNFRNGNRVERITIYDLLYGRDPSNPRKSTSIWPKSKATDFQWIHLPANNLAWVQALFTGSFIEDGGRDVEFLKALEQTFAHQHRGQKTHSHFMRPLCQTISRLQDLNNRTSADEPTEPPITVINLDHGLDSSSMANEPPKISSRDMQKKKTPRLAPSSKKSPAASLTPRKKKPTKNPIDSTPSSRKPPGVVVFMPYLHYETDHERQKMQEAIRQAESASSRTRRKAITFDEMLIRAYLAAPSVSMHVRRTLDQCFFHNSDTRNRDQDQVVYRYQQRSNEDGDSNPNIIMVDQLWMWILDDERVVTAFPQRWQQPKHDPMNLLNAIMDDINSKTREPVRSVYDLSMVITERCSSILDDRGANMDRYQFFKMFESSIGIANDREANLFIEFNNASVQASAWLERSRKTTSSTYEDSSAELESAAAVDKLLYIGQETSLLTETKDIRDELNMMANLFNDQMRVLPSVQEALCEIFKDQKRSTQDVRRRFGTEMRRIETRIKDLERMDRQTERIYSSVLDMLDLKQKHTANTNVFEARFAREQAEGSARQNQILMVFTIVTIIFLPLSFIAAFFTINIQEFQSVDGKNPLTLTYVSKWVFGVGLAISIPMVILALNLGKIVRFLGKLRMLMTRKRKYKVKEWDDVKGVELDILSLRSDAISRSIRGSQDAGFRIRQSRDIESA